MNKLTVTCECGRRIEVRIADASNDAGAMLQRAHARKVRDEMRILSSGIGEAVRVGICGEGGSEDVHALRRRGGGGM